jgi:hypothetical protein
MTSRLAGVGTFLRARRILVAARVLLGLWIAGWLAFVALVSVRASTELLSALGAVICILFAGSFALEITARRMAWRALTTQTQRDDLVASRSRRSFRERNRSRVR